MKPGRRASSPSLLANREAKKIAAPFMSRLGEGQVQIAQLRGIVGGPILDANTARQRATSLAATLAAERQQFEALVAQLDPSISANSRIIDARKAFANAMALLSAVQTSLTARPDLSTVPPEPRLQNDREAGTLAN